MMQDKLCIGTVQFGLNYGVSNINGKVSFNEAEKILSLGKEYSLNTLDTAINYGDSEKVLGNIGVDEWNVISKLPAIPKKCNDIESWIDNEVKKSLDLLKLPYLYAILIHNPDDINGANKEYIISGLMKLKKIGKVKKIGISIYDPSELTSLVGNFPIDIIQVPMNIFDRRILYSKEITQMKADGCEIHIRSIFLQGLLLMNNDNRPEKFNRWKNIWLEWEKWLTENNLTPLEACLSYAASSSLVDKIVIGLTSEAELNEILNTSINSNLKPPKIFDIEDKDLINPSNWNSL